MRGGAIDPTVLAGLSNNTPYVCGSTRIDQATALGKTEGYDFVYGVVRAVAAGGRQAAIEAGVRAVAAAVAAAVAGAGPPISAEVNYFSTHPNYVGLYKSGGNFYTVPINKAPGNVASDPSNGRPAVGPAVAPAPRAPIAPPGQLLTAAGAQADYIIVEA